MNEFLKTREQIDEATAWLQQNGYTTHPISCKDWELKQITQRIVDGDFLDMGADGSFCLHNAITKNTKGGKIGIDLAEVVGANRAEGAKYYQGDLTHTLFEDESFDMIVSQSTIEHEVNIKAFANEVSRLLRDKGKLIVSFDYWPEKINTDGLMLYGLRWNILSDGDVIDLIDECFNVGLRLTSQVDWATADAVINPAYCSPYPVEYTFGILEFIKK